MGEADGVPKRRMFRWPKKARELVRQYRERTSRSQEHHDADRRTLVTTLAEISGNPRDACLRFLRELGVNQKRAYRDYPGTDCCGTSYGGVASKLKLFLNALAAGPWLVGIGMACKNLTPFALPPATTLVVDLYHMLDLRSDARRRLLAYYFTNPAARHHLRDLAERLSTDPSNLSKELRRLEREGLFRSEISGRQKYFQLNREYPLFDEVRGIVGKTIGAAAMIRASLQKIEGIDEAYLYGSFAKNQQDTASDIDVLVIGTPRDEALAQAMRKLERQLGREINYTVFTPKEFESRRARKDAFLENVWHNKRIPLVAPDEEAKTAHR